MNREQVFNEFAKYVENDSEYYKNANHGIIEDVLAWLNIPSEVFIGVPSFVHAKNLEKLHLYIQNQATEEQLKQIYGLTKNIQLPKQSPMSESVGKVFVSMPMNKNKCSYVDDIRSGITDALINAGYEPYFLDKDSHNDNIVNKMIDEIATCRFLIADLTSQNNGVYYEAGYAKALGKTVIFSCKKDDFDNVHFDIRQTQIVVWDDVDDLKSKMENHIRNSVINGSDESYKEVELSKTSEKPVYGVRNKVIEGFWNKMQHINDALIDANNLSRENPNNIMFELEKVKNLVFDLVKYYDTNKYDLKVFKFGYEMWIGSWDRFVGLLKRYLNRPLSDDARTNLGDALSNFKEWTCRLIDDARKEIE